MQCVLYLTRSLKIQDLTLNCSTDYSFQIHSDYFYHPFVPQTDALKQKGLFDIQKLLNRSNVHCSTSYFRLCVIRH
jgi:hypothetical protein